MITKVTHGIASEPWLWGEGKIIAQQSSKGFEFSRQVKCSRVGYNYRKNCICLEMSG
jgi:hypothetical protein